MIRKAAPKDINAIMNIWLNVNIKAHNFISEKYWYSHIEDVQEAISTAEVYVYDDGEIKGFVGLVENYIAGIFVKENFQSQGIGGQLLLFLQGIKKELCLSVYEKNQKAVKFYQGHNFKIVKTNLEAETQQLEYQMIWQSNK